jgi:hypothetical protein
MRYAKAILAGLAALVAGLSAALVGDGALNLAEVLAALGTGIFASVGTGVLPNAGFVDLSKLNTLQRKDIEMIVSQPTPIRPYRGEV